MSRDIGETIVIILVFILCKVINHLKSIFILFHVARIKMNKSVFFTSKLASCFQTFMKGIYPRATKHILGKLEPCFLTNPTTASGPPLQDSLVSYMCKKARKHESKQKRTKDIFLL